MQTQPEAVVTARLSAHTFALSLRAFCDQAAVFQLAELSPETAATIAAFGGPLIDIGELAFVLRRDCPPVPSDVACARPCEYIRIDRRSGAPKTLGASDRSGLWSFSDPPVVTSILLRIVMSWYPEVKDNEMPWKIVYVPTEPILAPTRRIISPVGCALTLRWPSTVVIL